MFKILISTFILFTSLSFAMTQGEIKTEMTNKIDKVLLILKDSKLSKEEKGNEIISIMNNVFDYDLMSRLSLGREWKTLSNPQQDEFITLFTKKLKDSYVEKLDLYTDELVEILGVEQTKKTRIELKTLLLGKDAKHEIIYKFYKKNNEDKWLIYDVDLIGVSIIQTYRKQFSGFLNDKSFNDLLTYLKDPNKK